MTLHAVAGEMPQTTDAGLLTADQVTYLVKHARAELNRVFGIEAPEPGAPPQLPDDRVLAVNITLRVNGKLRASQSGKGDSILEKISSAMHNALNDRRFGGKSVAGEAADTTVELLLQTRREAVTGRTPEAVANEIALGVHGVAVRQGAKSAYYKPSVAITSGISSAAQLLEKLCRKAGLAKRAWESPAVEIDRTTWLHYVERRNAAGPGFVEFHRYRAKHRLPVNRKTVGQALDACVRHLLRLQRADGAYTYIYDPFDDEYISRGFNRIRIAGTAYAIARFADFTDDPKLRELSRASARRAVKYALGWAVPLPNADNAVFLMEKTGGRGKLGFAALVLLAMQYAGLHEDFAQQHDALLRGILLMQGDDGRLAGYALDRNNPGGQDFYPGEALLALAMLARRTGQGDLTPVLERSFPYYRDHFRSKPTTAFVPWQLDAWQTFNRIQPDPKYTHFADKLADFLITLQYAPKTSPFQDYVGGFPTTRAPDYTTGTHTESLVVAARSAKERGLKSRWDRYRDAARSGLSFLLRLQITENELFAFPSPQLASGGFTKGLTSFKQRCDFQQHAITCLISALECPGLLKDE